MNPVTKKEELHNGLDIAVEENTNVLAVYDAVVEDASYDSFNGNYVRLETTNGYTVTYCHLNKALVEPGDIVRQGQSVALSGNTGRSSGPHLHYTLKKDDELLDPLNFVVLKKKN